MQKLLLKLLEMMGATAGGDVTVEGIDYYMWHIELPLGKIDAGTYEGKHWGDSKINDTDATLAFSVGNIYDANTFSIGEGHVNLNYTDDNEGLAYTGDLEDVVTARIKDLYNLSSDGSEQGMQGDDYISLDLWMDDLYDGRPNGGELTPEEIDVDESEEDNLDKVIAQFSPHPSVRDAA
jgi:hypothetical protein